MEKFLEQQELILRQQREIISAVSRLEDMMNLIEK